MEKSKNDKPKPAANNEKTNGDKSKGAEKEKKLLSKKVERKLSVELQTAPSREESKRVSNDKKEVSRKGGSREQKPRSAASAKGFSAPKVSTHRQSVSRKVSQRSIFRHPSDCDVVSKRKTGKKSPSLAMKLQRTQSGSKHEPYKTTPIEYVKNKDTFDYPGFIDRHFVDLGSTVKSFKYTLKEIVHIVNAAMYQLSQESMLVEIPAPVVVVGDIHGQFNDLINIFVVCGRPPEKKFLFLGDYVDRGRMSFETVILLFAYKAAYPRSIYLLRGNHECARVNKNYGFLETCKALDEGEKVYNLCTRAFNYLSIAAVISERILCTHGGLSPALTDLQHLRDIKKPLRNPLRGLCNDMMWSDPDVHEDIGFSGWRPNTRNSGYMFGAQAFEEYMDRLGCDVLIRGHQVCLGGYSTAFNGRCITIFSAPSYTNQYKNAGGIVRISEELECEIIVFLPNWIDRGDAIVKKRNRAYDEALDNLIGEPTHLYPIKFMH